MGEYATYGGSRIKIGTCESMYYLRADQRALISGYSFDPGDRFRFPFPDEDNIEPGCFEDYDRGVKIPGWHLPETFGDHGIVQFVASAGYNLCLPCPEQTGQHGLGPVDVDGVKVHRNGFNGHPVVKQQRYYDGRLVTVVACGACGSAWRLETIDDARPVIEAFRAEAARTENRRQYDFDRDEFTNEYAIEYANSETHRAFLLTIADRIEAGYLEAVQS